MVIAIELKHNDYIVDELRLTVLEKIIEVGEEVTEQELDELFLEFGRELAVELKRLNDLSMIPPERFV